MLRGVETIIGVINSMEVPDHLVPFINFDGYRQILNFGFQDTKIIAAWATNVENRVVDCVITVEALTRADFESIELCAKNELTNKLNFWRKYK